MSHQDAIVKLSNVHKSFADLEVIRGINLEIKRGELLTMLGVNGAGKTTTINMMLGLQKPTAGDIALFGESPEHQPTRQRIGVTPQNTGLPEEIKVKEILEFVGAHYLKPKSIEEVARLFGLADLLERAAHGLSGGQKRRIAVALAFVGNPDIVFLDEPTTGLDVESRQQIWLAIQAYLAQGGTAFLTTHYLEEAESLSTRIVILEQGKIKVEGTVTDIKALAGLARIKFKAPQIPDDLHYVAKREQYNGHFILHTEQVDALVRELVRRDIAFRDLQIIESSLESAYLKMTESNNAK
jgi:ABC-2 type transport system ATP-binding protein